MQFFSIPYTMRNNQNKMEKKKKRKNVDPLGCIEVSHKSKDGVNSIGWKSWQWCSGSG